MAGLHKPLLNEGSPLIMKKEGVPAILFDQASIFALAPHIVDGYLILLGKPEAATGASCKPDGLSDGDLDLQFQALSSGNVLDACFGVQASSPTAASNAKAAKEAKEFLTGLALLPEPKGRQVKRLAVAAYAEIFLKVKEHKQATEGAGKGGMAFVCCCLPSPIGESEPLKQKCLAEINAAFSMFVDAV